MNESFDNLTVGKDHDPKLENHNITIWQINHKYIFKKKKEITLLHSKNYHWKSKTKRKNKTENVYITEKILLFIYRIYIYYYLYTIYIQDIYVCIYSQEINKIKTNGSLYKRTEYIHSPQENYGYKFFFRRLKGV